MNDEVQDRLAAAERALAEAQSALHAAKEAAAAARHADLAGPRQHASGVPMDEHADPVRKFPRPKPRSSG